MLELPKLVCRAFAALDLRYFFSRPTITLVGGRASSLIGAGVTLYRIELGTCYRAAQSATFFMTMAVET